MLCELCHKSEAKSAILHKTEDGEKELYVCAECARVHEDEVVKPDNAEDEDSQSSDPAEEILKVASDVAETIAGAFKAIGAKINEAKTCPTLDLSGYDKDYVYCGALHLKALEMLGEFKHVVSTIHAVGLHIVPLALDGSTCLGGAFKIGYSVGDEALARRTADELVMQERLARKRVVAEKVLMLEDSAARAVAMLRSCKLLSRAEKVDVFSVLKFVKLYMSLPKLPNAYINREVKALAKEIEKQRRDDSKGHSNLEESAASAVAANKFFEAMDLKSIHLLKKYQKYL